MAQQIIGIGTNPNDGTGDDIRISFDKVNDNFTEIYTELGGTSLSNLTINGNTLSSDDTNGNINFDPNGTGDVVIESGDFMPASDSAIQNIGSASDIWTNIYVHQAYITRIELSGLLVAPNLPTSATGLATGTVWSNGGVLTVV